MVGQHHDGKDIGRNEGIAMTKPDTPFPRHWLYYIVLKYGVIVVAIVLALYVAWRVFGGAA